MTDFEQIHQLKISLIEKAGTLKKNIRTMALESSSAITSLQDDVTGTANSPMLLQVISSVSVKYAKQSQKAGHCLTPFRNYMTNAPGHG